MLPTFAAFVPLVANGAKPFHSYYGFTLGNGGVSEEGAICAGWLREKGFQKVAAVTEIWSGLQLVIRVKDRLP